MLLINQKIQIRKLFTTRILKKMKKDTKKCTQCLFAR